MGESAIHGWIIDAYGDYDRDQMVLWLWNERPALLPAVRDGPRALPDGPRAVRERHLDPGGGALRPRVSAAAAEEGAARPARRQSRGHPADAGQAARGAHR